MFIIYSKANCSKCEIAKMTLYVKHKEFTIKKLDEDFTIEWFLSEFNSRSFPVVVDTDTDTVYKTVEELQTKL